jgi:hypothetical protein
MAAVPTLVQRHIRLDAASLSPHVHLGEARSVEALPGGAWLVTRLQQAVEAGFKVATGSSETLRPWGLLLLQRLVVLFDGVLDPDYDGHCLLEQYQVHPRWSHDALYGCCMRAERREAVRCVRAALL